MTWHLCTVPGKWRSTQQEGLQRAAISEYRGYQCRLTFPTRTVYKHTITTSPAQLTARYIPLSLPCYLTLCYLCYVYATAPCLGHSFLSSIYTSAIPKISRIHNVQQQQYTDDTQLHVPVWTPTTRYLLCNHAWSPIRPGFVKTEWLRISLMPRSIRFS